MKRYESYLTLEQLAELTGVTRKDIESYNDFELLPVIYAEQVLYRPNAVEVVRFIRRALRLGFSLEETRLMISMIEMFGGGGDYVGAVVRDKITAIRMQLTELIELERELLSFETHCRNDLHYLSAVASSPGACGALQA